MQTNLHALDLLAIDAAILAGGCGTRLRPVMSDRPKPLAPVCNRPFITLLLDQLAHAGLRYAVLCTGYGGDQVQKAVGESYGNLQIAYSCELTALGTGGALRLAANHFRTDTMLVLNGDSYCDFVLNAFYQEHLHQNARASILLACVDDTSRYGCVQFADDGSITRFNEKSAAGGPGWINAGVYLIERRLIESIQTGRAVSLEREVFPAWIGRGLFGYRCDGRFIDIGTPESYAAAESFFAA